MALVVTQLFKDNMLAEGINMDGGDRSLLKRLIFEVCNRIDLKTLKPIINSLSSVCFHDLAENFGCFHKVPSLLLDEEESRLSSLWFTSQDILGRA